MPVVEVRIVGMPMHQRTVLVPMGMRLTGRVAGAVRVPMTFVVPVAMRMRHPHVRVFVLVPLGEVRPHTERHRGSGDARPQRYRLIRRHDRQGDADDRRDREVRRGSGRTQIAPGDHVKRKPHP